MDRLLEDVEVVSMRGRAGDAEVTSVEYDSRQVASGALFCCLTGAHHDGHDYAEQAIARGSVGLVVERELSFEVPQALVRPGGARRAMGLAAATLEGHPARDLETVGVTGTNGKTTVTHLLAAILEANGQPTAVIGTLGGARTTPEAPVLQRLLAQARDAGRVAAALEVSSHALSYERVEGICFDAAVFTNLGHDHLDYHKTMEAYFEAKASLFVPGRARLGVVNSGDAWGRRLIECAEIEIVPYSAEDASYVEPGARATSFEWRGRRVELALAGLFQVPNAIAAATTASALGVADDIVVRGLSDARPVPGRFEVLETGTPFTVVVDYAHTPEGLEFALRSARAIAGGARVLLVFGAGGERDHEKRPAMGAAASEAADVVVVTSDNPRGEDPLAIVASVMEGVGPSADAIAEPDRARAIELAFATARAGDVVLIAGKGHETDMEIGGKRVPFDDHEVARAVAARMAHPNQAREGRT